MKLKGITSFVTKSLIFAIFPNIVVMTTFNNGLGKEIASKSMTENLGPFLSINDIPDQRLESLAKKKIYFGHHSVGANIIDGIRDLMIEHPNLSINIVKTVKESDFKVGLFAHSGVGKNMDPQSKINDFARIIESGIGQKADIAGFKFCYVDIRLDTDVDTLLDEYSESVDKLETQYADLQIIHFTIPLKQQRTTWKNLIKKILFIDDPWRYGPNINRNMYNKKLIERYKDKDFIFDIAAIESTYPDGGRSTFSVDNQTYYSLVPEYTSDGGHLNELGRKKVAEQLIIFLANID